MSDEEIIAMFFDRQEEAVSEVKRTYGPLCQRLTEHVIGSHEDTDEILNDALLALWNAMPPMKPDNLRAYLIKTVRNLALRRLSYNLAEKRRTYSKVAFDELEEVLSDYQARAKLDKIDLDIVIGEFLKEL